MRPKTGTCRAEAGRDLSREGGFSLLEVLVSTAIMLVVTGTIFSVMNPTHGSFASALLPGYLLVGTGMAFAFIPMSIAALAGVENHEAGLASGLINTSQQIGGALGVAIASTVAFTHMGTLLKSGHSPADAQTSGFALGFWVIAAIGAVAVLATFFLVRGEELEAVDAEAAQAI